MTVLYTSLHTLENLPIHLMTA